MLNKSLKKSDLDETFRPFFQDEKYDVVVIPKGTRLWKLSAYPITKEGETNWKGEKKNVSPWWSNVNPFRDDRAGIAARIEEAKLNGVSFKNYIRFASAVRIDWNMLSSYQEVTLTEDAKAFWGLFGATVSLTPEGEVAERSRANWEKAKAKLEELKEDICLPDLLGGLDDVYQFYIPNIYPEHLVQSYSKNLHDKGTIEVSAFGAKVVNG